jgi:hypothetical protein
VSASLLLSSRALPSFQRQSTMLLIFLLFLSHFSLRGAQLCSDAERHSLKKKKQTMINQTTA